MDIPSYQEIAIAIIAGVILVVLLIALGHWVPTGPKRNQLPKTLAGLISRYTYGTFVIWLSTATAFAILGYLWLILIPLIICIAAGATVVATYGWDNVIHAFTQRNIAEAADDELRPQR